MPRMLIAPLAILAALVLAPAPAAAQDGARNTVGTSLIVLPAARAEYDTTRGADAAPGVSGLQQAIVGLFPPEAAEPASTAVAPAPGSPARGETDAPRRVVWIITPNA